MFFEIGQFFSFTEFCFSPIFLLIQSVTFPMSSDDLILGLQPNNMLCVVDQH